MVIGDTQTYRMKRWIDFNTAFEKMNLLIPMNSPSPLTITETKSDDNDNSESYSWLSEKDIPIVLNTYGNVRDDKIISALLLDYPITPIKLNKKEKDFKKLLFENKSAIEESKAVKKFIRYPNKNNNAKFIKNYELIFHRYFFNSLFLILFIMITILSLSCLSYLNKNWDSKKIIKRSLYIILAFIIISLYGNISSYSEDNFFMKHKTGFKIKNKTYEMKPELWAKFSNYKRK